MIRYIHPHTSYWDLCAWSVWVASAFNNPSEKMSFDDAIEMVTGATRADLVQMHKKHVTPENMILTIVGNFDLDQMADKTYPKNHPWHNSWHRWTCEDCNTPPAVCGDMTCDVGEDANNCPEDCTVCGDMLCTGSEDVNNCHGDCAVCGDMVCSPGEDEFNCPDDCGGGGFCGDMTCDAGEDEFNCPEDCGGGPPQVCGDMICHPDEVGWCFEDCP